MISLTATLLLLLTPTSYEVGTWSNSYDFTFKYHYSDYIQTEDTLKAFFCENDIEFNGYLRFNDALNYEIGFLNYKLHNTIYSIDLDNDGGVFLEYDDYSIENVPVFTMEDISAVTLYSAFNQNDDKCYYYNYIRYPYGTGYLTSDNQSVLAAEDIYLNGQFANNDLLHVVSFDASTLQSQINNLVASVGFEGGYDVGYSDGYRDGKGEGYSEGFGDGLNEGVNMDGTVITIFNGILSVALVPVNFFLGIFNFEILGINITGFVTALLSVCVVIVLIRLIFGGKASGGKE